MERGEERPQEPVEALIDSQGETTSGGEFNPFADLQEQANPETFELISILYDMHSLRNSLQSAAEEQQPQQNTQDISSKTTEKYDKSLNIDPSFAERYRRGSLFVDAALHIMRGSFTAHPEDPEYLRNVLDTAFSPYGFKIIEGSIAEIEKQDAYAFRSKLDYQRERYEESRRGKKISSKMLEFYSGEDQYGADQWGAIGQWQEAPEVIQFAQELTKIDDVRSRMPDSHRYVDSENRTENVPGLHPTYRERYYWAGVFLEETQFVMTEGISPYENGSSRPLISLVNHFNDALNDLDMHIDVNPDWQPGQAPQPRMEREARPPKPAVSSHGNEAESTPNMDFDAERNHWITDADFIEANYLPDNYIAPEQRLPTPQAEYDAIEARLDEMLDAGEKLPPDFFLLNLKRRVLGNKLKMAETSMEDMKNHLILISDEAEARRNEEAQTAITKIQWAFLTLAAQNDVEIITANDIQKYNKLQQEYSEKGQVARGVELSPELTQHLAWMVDRVQLPYDVGEGAICIPFDSLEQNMRIAAPAWEDTWRPDSFYPDHEKRASVPELMEQWKQSQGNQEG